MIDVVGGVYGEYCMWPHWREIYGSAGRAASALRAIGCETQLHTYADSSALDVLQSRAALDDIKLAAVSIDRSIAFDYCHGLATPEIYNTEINPAPLHVNADKIIRFGMIESEAIVDGNYVVYDPQNVQNPQHFSTNNSRANHLALILNQAEARTLSGITADPEKAIAALIAQTGAEVIVMKAGPLGAYVHHSGTTVRVPAYRTSNVWKIGSGDVFVAHFASNWFSGLSPLEAAQNASKATAYYCETVGFPNTQQLSSFCPSPINPGNKFNSENPPTVYLAGPFFALSQRWIIEEARKSLLSMGLKVFSPFHDVGHGCAADVVKLDIEGIKQCDLMLAIGDGLDSGTLYEVGYARALDKPVIFYCENESEENVKMMVGSDCTVVKDYVTAIYHTVWAGVEL